MKSKDKIIKELNALSVTLEKALTDNFGCDGNRKTKCYKCIARYVCRPSIRMIEEIETLVSNLTK